VPRFLYGTAWKEERTRPLTELALQAGFAGIDTANQRRHYLEAAVGEALASALPALSLARSQVFLQTKYTFVDGQDHRLPYDSKAPLAVQVQQSFESSLEHLRTDYVDSYLLHGPASRKGIGPDDWAVWHAMEALARSGQARFIGVSNVSLAQLKALYAGADIKPAFVQNRCYARQGWDREVRAFCSANDLLYQGFSLLTANQRELSRPEVARVVERSGRTPAEVVFSFALAVGILPLTGTSRSEHMRADLDCLDFELPAATAAVLANIDSATS
jgi:diketogulonate reductase-like aldo/keto reductase